MKQIKKNIISIVWITIGITLIVLSLIEKLDEFWSGCGASLLVVGITQLLRSYRINKNEAYREQVEVELSDERNRFIRSKAWAWSGYLFVLIAAVASIVFKIFDQNLLSMASGAAVCIIILLYWISYALLKRKY